MARQSSVSSIVPQECLVSGACLCGRVMGCQQSETVVTERNLRTLSRGEYLFHTGDRLNHLYVVRAGAFKSSSLSEDGTEQVLAFYFPGETIGLDVLGHGYADTDVISLDTSRVCALPVSRIMDSARESNEVLMELWAGVHSEMRRLRTLVQMERRSADERLAAFLIAFSKHAERRGFCGLEFELPMSRRDLAFFLGLASETLSRMFARFQESGLLEAHRKNIRLVDTRKLCEIAGELLETTLETDGDRTRNFGGSLF